MNARRRAFFELNGALILSSLTALFGKIILLPVNQLIFGRALIGAVTLWCFLKWTETDLRLRDRCDYGWFIGSGILLAIHWVTYFHAIQISTVAISMVAFYTYPVLAILLEPLVDRKPYRMQDIVIGAVVFGGVCILAPEWDWSNPIAQGVVWGVFSALVYAIRNLVSRRHVRRFSGATVLFYQLIGVVICLLPFLGMNFSSFDASQIPSLLLMGTVFTVVHHSIITHCLKTLPVKTMSIIGTIQPVYGALLAWGFLYEPPAMRTVLGGLIILAAAAYEIRWGKRD